MSLLLNGELVLYGFVGENFWGDGFTAREVLDALTEHGRDQDIVVRINSGGGYVDDGVAIFNALKAHAGKVTVIVDAIAASSASIIAMAGDERLMRTGAMMMIHDPSGGIWGTAEDMERHAKVMEKHGENLASIYAEVTGEEAADIRADMRRELWMTADEAVERGYATAVEKKKAKAVAAHDYSLYSHAPERLVALTKSNNWTRATAQKPAGAGAPAKFSFEKENTAMTKPMEADASASTDKIVAQAVAKAVADSKARVKSILASEDAKGREALAEHLAHDTDMPAEAAVALLAKAPKAALSEETEAPAAGAGLGAATAAYEQKRLAAAHLAMPGGAPAGSSHQGGGAWSTAVAKANARLKGN